jgi:hypothetical protein
MQGSGRRARVKYPIYSGYPRRIRARRCSSRTSRSCFPGWTGPLGHPSQFRYSLSGPGRAWPHHLDDTARSIAPVKNAFTRRFQLIAGSLASFLLSATPVQHVFVFALGRRIAIADTAASSLVYICATESSYTTSSAKPRKSICRFTCRGFGREKGCSWGIHRIASGSHFLCAMTATSRSFVEDSSFTNVAVFRREQSLAQCRPEMLQPIFRAQPVSMAMNAKPKHSCPRHGDRSRKKQGARPIKTAAQAGWVGLRSTQ